VARPLFEQYKDALRRGHVALLGDELDAALEAYREAAGLVPERPLPYVSIGTVLARLGQGEAALAAFDRALAIAPDEESTLQARAALLNQMAGVAPESEPTAADLAPLIPEPQLASADAAPPTPEPPPASADGAPPIPEPPPAPAADVPAPLPAPEPTPATAPAAPGVGWPAIDLPSAPPPPLLGPPPDPEILQAEANAFVDAGDPLAARDPLLLAMAVHREAGRVDAALDACLQLLAIAPGDARVHLAIANLQLDRGWRSVATEKIELLLRLTSLSGDAQAEADVHLLAADRLRDESPARLDARRRGVAAP
jgi:tetratricopeptide (TPR) repeat protein